MPRGIVIEVIGDERSYLRAAENTIATNAKLDASFKRVGVNANLSADAQIKAAVRAQEAMRANVAALSSRATSLPAGSKEQIAAAALAADAQAKLNRSLGITTVATGRTGTAAKTAERDLNKMTRGVLSGSGALSRFGRSLAFASTGFLGFAIGASVVSKGIDAAENLTKAQESLNVAIKHTGGNLAELQPRYEAIAKAAAQFGVSQLDATTGLARATVLTGNAAAAQRAYQEALVISKATGKDFNAVLTATSKGQEGITTSLRRYGILIDAGTKGTAQFALVMKRFGGQAEANTSASDKFRASFANFEATLGQALLPTFDRYVGKLSAWLQKMQDSGRLQEDVNAIVGTTTSVFRGVGRVIGAVDKVTGSFENTLKILIGLKIASVISGWVGPIKNLAAVLKDLGIALGVLRAAEGVTGGGRGAGGGGGGIAADLERIGGGAAGGGAVGAAARFARLGRAIDISAPFAPFAAVVAVGAESPVFGPKNIRIQGYTSQGTPIGLGSDGNYYEIGGRGYRPIKGGRALIASLVGVPGAPVITKELRSLPSTGNIVPQAFQIPGFQAPSRAQQTTGPFGTARPLPRIKTVDLTGMEQIAQAQAQLTRTTQDDVRVARQVLARVKRLIATGRLTGKAMLQALGLEASALSTIWSAEDAAAQARAQKAQEAQQRIQTQIQNAIDPLRLEVALSRAQAFGQPILPRLRALLRAAEEGLRKAIAAHNLQLEKQALDQITSLKQQIRDAATQPTVTFQMPARLALALARDEALGRDPTKDLLKAKAAILRFIRTHRKNIAALTDAYQQLASINQQLGQTVSAALGMFKQASTKALTAGLGLTAAQRKAEEQRLAGLGPGFTVSGSGTGAAGFAIDPNTGRPIVLDHRQRRQQGRVGGRPQPIENNIDLNVYIDGHHVEATVTKRQEKRNRRNPPQRRGPHAGR